MSLAESVVLNGERDIDIEDVFRVAVKGATILLDPGLEARLTASRAVMLRGIRTGKAIYGVTTGFGPLAGRMIEADDCSTLQRNLVYHLASGVGPPFSRAQTRALMFCRLVNLTRGYSAVAPEAPELLAQWLNKDLIPYVPSLGTVGASGDLTPLAHVTLALIGEGPVWYQGGPVPARERAEALGLPLLSLANREALAFVNGTSAMTGLAALNAATFASLSRRALNQGLFFAELLNGNREHYSPLLGRARGQIGQIQVLEILAQLTQKKARLKNRNTELGLSARATATDVPEPIQQPYTVRCLPQIYGAVWDVRRFHDDIVRREINAATDNPLFFAEEDEIIHGGNFYGQHIAFAADALNNAVIKTAIHLERKINRLTHPQLSPEFPAFLQPNQLGLQSGFMGAQVTATALVAEMRGRSVPLSIQSIATNGDNQDVVTMGTLAALKTSQLLDLLARLVAIDAMVCAQAYDLLPKAEQQKCSSTCEQIHREVREKVAFLEQDRPLSQDIETLAEHYLGAELGKPERL